jgi:hypothetical protein
MIYNIILEGVTGLTFAEKCTSRTVLIGLFRHVVFPEFLKIIPFVLVKLWFHSVHRGM